MSPRAGRIAEKTDVKTVAKIAGKIVARTASTIAAVRATRIANDRTLQTVPGTDSMATSKIANS